MWQRLKLKNGHRAGQMLLFDIGPADGIIGKKTRKAIIEFQAKAGTNPDGKISTKLISLLERVETS